jgi:hypothetical protein
MTYGRSVGKALDTFGLDHNKWPKLAADRLAWRAMLRTAECGEPSRLVPRAVSDPRRPAHRAHTHGPKRPMAATNAAIQNSMQQLSLRRRGSA